MNSTSRRKFLQLSAGILSFSVFAKASGVSAQTPQIPKPASDLKESDQLAQSLGYYKDHTKVDTKKWPKKVGNQRCDNCQLYVKFPGEKNRGGCALFVGKWVEAAGWCNGYVSMAKKP